MVPGLSPFRRKAPFRGNLSVLDRSGQRERRLGFAANRPESLVGIVVGVTLRHASLQGLLAERPHAILVVVHLGHVQVTAVVLRNGPDASIGNYSYCKSYP